MKLLVFFSLFSLVFSLLTPKISSASPHSLQLSEDGSSYILCGIPVLVTKTATLPAYISAQGKKKDYLMFDAELEPKFTSCKITGGYALVISLNNGSSEAFFIDGLQLISTRDYL